MLCKIADLLIDVPATGDMLSRCKDYQTAQNDSADIIIRAERYKPKKYPTLSEADIAYLESGSQFCNALPHFNGFYLHSSAVAYEGRAYLFSGPSGMGKSTHTRLWQQLFGDAAVVFNDDKPVLRCIDGTWYAYGTPWCGKDGINRNIKVKLGGICFLRRGNENKISRLDGFSATTRILSQTTRRLRNEEKLDLLLSHIDDVVQKIPIFEFFNLPVLNAAQVSYETMSRAAKEAGL